MRSVSFVVGSVCLFQLAQIPGTWILVALAGAVLLCGRRVSAVSFFVAGFVMAAVHAALLLDQRLGSDWLHREVMVSGVVIGLPEYTDSRLRFQLKLKQLHQPESAAVIDAGNGVIRLNWYQNQPLVSAGDRWTLKVKLREPSGFMNPGGFDYEKWLFQRRIVATGYVRDADTAVKDTGYTSPLAWLQQGRAWLKARLLVATAEFKHSALIMALAIGDRSAIPRVQWQRFIDTGTNHLLAISGLHITLVAAFAAALAKWLWGRIARARETRRNTFVIMFAVLAAAMYAALAGFSVPTQRALLMFVTLSVLSVVARHQKRHSALAVALMVVCAINPLVVLSAGFWMSFAAVAILFAVYSYIPHSEWRMQVMGVLRGHFLITIGLYPLALLFFGQMSLVSPVANFFAVPVVGLLLTPTIFVASIAAAVHPAVARVILYPVDVVLALVDWFLALLSRWELALVQFGEVRAGMLVCVITIAAIGLIPLAARLRWLVCVLALPLIFPVVQSPPHGGYSVTFLDVGQGTAVVVRTRKHTLVYDTGPQYSASFNAADAVILPFLNAKGVRHVDRLIVSHSDRDHSGGAEELQAGIRVDETFTSAAMEELPGSRRCRAGQAWQWDGVMFRVLYPSNTDTGSKNDRSCTLLISTEGLRHTLLAGDVEAAGEARLVARGVPEIDVLLAPHHGSATSSRQPFLTATVPAHVVYTTSFRNRYGFPVADVQNRYNATGTVQHNTATDGAVTFEISDHKEIRVSAYRLQRRSLWSRASEP